MSSSRPRAPLGRPKDHAKHGAILKAGMELFARQPFDTVTMESVAAQAGVSKMTVYNHFSDKETLFENIVTSVCDQMIAAFPPPDRSNAPLEDKLTSIGTAFLTIILGPLVVSMAHALPAALRDNPTLAQRFYNAGPGRMKAALAAIIADAAANKTLTVDSPTLAAEDLLSLWEGGLQSLCAFGMVKPVGGAEIAQRARRGTRLFLRAYAPDT